MWASTQAKKMGDADSSSLKDTSDWMLYQTHNINNSKFLYFRAMPLVVYTKNNMKKAMAEKWLFFDKKFNLIPKYSFIQKISEPDNNELRLEKYIRFTAEENEDFKKKGILKYYWK